MKHHMKTHLARLMALILCLVVAGLSMASAETLQVQIDRKDLSLAENLPKQVRLILVLLCDAQSGSTYGPSDTMMIAAINTQTGDAKMVVLQSSLVVDMPQVGRAPLSQAYALGGENLALKTVNQVFGLNIKDFLAIEMNKFTNVVDVVGGISIKLGEADAQALGLAAGEALLTPQQTLQYMRLPKSSPADEKQYRVFLQALTQGTRDRNIGKLGGLLLKTLDSMKTNIGYLDLAGLGGKVLDGKGREEMLIPDPQALTATTWQQQNAYEADIQQAKSALHAFVYGAGVSK